MDGMIARLYSYAGELRDMCALRDALVQAGYRAMPPGLNSLAICRNMYEKGPSPILHNQVRSDDVESLARDLPVFALGNPNVKWDKATLLHQACYGLNLKCLRFLLQHQQLNCLLHLNTQGYSCLTIALAYSAEHTLVNEKVLLHVVNEV
jgi:hypothetical protein